MPPNNAGVAIDLRQYNDRAQKGAVSIQRLGPKSFQMILRNFDPANGQEMEPGVVPINQDGLQASIDQTKEQMANLQTALDSLTQLQSDMERMEKENISIHNSQQASPTS